MAASVARSGGRGARALWFRGDLRLDDNPALQAAVSGAAAVLPVFVFDPRKFNAPTLAGARKSSARRARFLIESVACLRRRLESKGSGLAVALGRPEVELPRLCAGADAGVWCQEGFCTEEKAEESKVGVGLKGGKLHRVWGGSLYAPDECGCPPDNAPLLFTAFKNKAEGRGRIRSPVAAPKQMPPLPPLASGEGALKFMPTLKDLGYPEKEAAAATMDDSRGVMVFKGGEDAALERLQKWMFDDDKLQEYFDIRNGMLGEGYSSKLSPWLALGCISPRRIWQEAKRYEAERVKNKSTYWLVFELTWRDFFIYMARSQGAKIFVRGGVVGDRTPWKKNPAGLQKWKEGRTGDPLVDANMRELAATGFMSNRGRQNVASYLIFDSGVDWRYGAAHFEEHLLDYDPASNWGNWVAAAGLTGQRVNRFNTRKQLSDYDPQRKYVKHWLEGHGSLVASASAVAPGASRAPPGAAAVDTDEAARRHRHIWELAQEKMAAPGAAKWALVLEDDAGIDAASIKRLQMSDPARALRETLERVPDDVDLVFLDERHCSGSQAQKLGQGLDPWAYSSTAYAITARAAAALLSEPFNKNSDHWLNVPIIQGKIQGYCPSEPIFTHNFEHESTINKMGNKVLFADDRLARRPHEAAAAALLQR